VEFINLSEAGSDALTAASRLAAYHHDQGRKIYIEASDESEAQDIDKRLWTFADGSFVPHSIEQGPDQVEEPVLIGVETANPNQAEVLILLHPEDPSDRISFKTAILLIPVESGPKLEACRALYAKLRDAGQAEVVHITTLP
jgi:DNA polymerase-3 subunit chi